MKKIFLLWKLEIKQVLAQFPKMLLTIFVIIGILGAIGYSAAKLWYRNVPMIQITVGVAEEEENKTTDFLLAYLGNMESTAKHCTFQRMDKEEGFALLEEQKIAALLVLPSQVIEGILTGNNAPVQIYFPQDAGVESALLKALTDAGVGMLQVAQAEIYGIYDTAKRYDALEHLAMLETDINEQNLAFALDRMALYQEKEIAGVGKLTWEQYGITLAVVFFVLLFGMSCFSFMNPYTKEVAGQLARQGIGRGLQEIGKWLCGFLCLLLGLFCGIFICYGTSVLFQWEALKQALSQMVEQPIWYQGLVWLLVLSSTTTFFFMIDRLCNHTVSAILLTFVLIVIMFGTAVGFGMVTDFYSTASHKIVAIVVSALPTSYLLPAAGSLFTGEITGKTIGGILGNMVLYGVISQLVVRWREQRENIR